MTGVSVLLDRIRVRMQKGEMGDAKDAALPPATGYSYRGGSS
jgi:hypothetical protein